MNQYLVNVVRWLKRYRLYIAAVIGGSGILISIVRAANMLITYDEAYTYVQYVTIFSFDYDRVMEIYHHCWANNHWLNTALIYCADALSGNMFQDFIMRVPNIVAAVIYVAAAFKMYQSHKIGAAQYYLLVCNYYLNEYFSLARGYGLGTCFSLVAIYAYMKWKESHYQKRIYLCGLCISFFLAISSNTVFLIAAPAIGILCLYRLIENHQMIRFLKAYGIFVVGFIIGLVWMLCYHFQISQTGLPLYTGEQKSFVDAVIFACAKMFTDSNVLAVIIVIIGVLAFLLSFFMRYIKKDANIEIEYAYVILGIMLTMLLLEVVLKKGYPTGRGLLPFYPWLIIGLTPGLRGLKSIGGINTYWIVNSTICICAVVLFFAGIDMAGTRDFYTDPQVRSEIYQSVIDGSFHLDTDISTLNHPVETYYQMQLRYILR